MRQQPRAGGHEKDLGRRSRVVSDERRRVERGEHVDAEAARERTDERPPTNAEARPRAEPSAPGGGRKRNKRNKRKAASRSSGDGLGLLAKGMK